MQVVHSVGGWTNTSHDRRMALIRATKHIVRHNIPGCFVECGVGRGGSSLAIMKTVLNVGGVPRDIYLYDTYEGMPQPGPEDIDFASKPAGKRFVQFKLSHNKGTRWWNIPVERVKQIIYVKTHYPRDKIHFVVGKVEDTIPDQAPKQISLLRLDTDWYESTKHELTHLYPRLVSGGIILIDDYGYWKGVGKAVDEYFAEIPDPILFHAIDYTGRIAVKP